MAINIAMSDKACMHILSDIEPGQQITYDMVVLSKLRFFIKKLNKISNINVFVMNFDANVMSKWVYDIFEYYELFSFCLSISKKDLEKTLLSYNIDIYFSTDMYESKELQKRGIASVYISEEHLYGMEPILDLSRLESKDIRLAFDFDATLVNSESDDVYRKSGLQAFNDYEVVNKTKPLKALPLIAFLQKIYNVQQRDGKFPIITYLVTARGDIVKDRCLNTLEYYNVDVNEKHFLNGANKGVKLREIGADLFIDDSLTHITTATLNGIISAQVF